MDLTDDYGRRLRKITIDEAARGKHIWESDIVGLLYTGGWAS